MKNALSPEQSLALIGSMIQEAKRSYQKIHFYFLLWGVLFTVAGLVSFFMMRSGSPLHWVIWPVMGVLGGIISGVRGAREGREQGVMTMMDRLHMWLWIAYTLTLVLMLIALVTKGVDPNPFVLVLTGLPTFVTGALIRHKPLIIGGILFWLSGSILFFALKPYSSLVFSLAILLGYVIPGLMLKKEENGLRTA